MTIKSTSVYVDSEKIIYQEVSNVWRNERSRLTKKWPIIR